MVSGLLTELEIKVIDVTEPGSDKIYLACFANSHAQVGKCSVW